jgi:hypothetical protein
VSRSAQKKRRRPPVAALLYGALTIAGLAALLAAMVPVGPDWLDGAGAVTVAVTYTSALAARTGGRPIVFGTVALLVGIATLLTEEDYLRTGSAVMT